MDDSLKEPNETVKVSLTLPSNSVTFQPGETLKNIPINIVDDRLVAPKETLLLALPINAVLGTTKRHTITIQDNDPLVGFDVLPPIVIVTSPTKWLADKQQRDRRWSGYRRLFWRQESASQRRWRSGQQRLGRCQRLLGVSKSQAFQW